MRPAALALCRQGRTTLLSESSNAQYVSAQVLRQVVVTVAVVTACGPSALRRQEAQGRSFFTGIFGGPLLGAPSLKPFTYMYINTYIYIYIYTYTCIYAYM